MLAASVLYMCIDIVKGSSIRCKICHIAYFGLWCGAIHLLPGRLHQTTIFRQPNYLFYNKALVSQFPKKLEYSIYYIVFLDFQKSKWVVQDLLPAVLATLRDSEDEVATAVVPFLNSWVARLKANQKRTGGVPTVSFWY